MPREKSIPERFDAYVEKVGGRLYKPCRRFLRESLFGLLEKKSVLLSQIGRALKEPSRLIHTEKRLSRNLGNKRYDDAAVEQDYLQLVAPILRDERYPRPVIAVDLTDIAKPRARKMPYLYKVHDGSKDQIANGYQIVSVEAVGVRGRRLPLISRLFSHAAPGFKSQNATALDAVATVRPHVPKDAFWVFDSGFDGHIFFRRFDEIGIPYAVRLKLSNDRLLRTPDGEMKVSEAVELLPQPHTHRIKFQRREGKGWKKKDLQLGFVRNVHLPLYTPGGRPSKNKDGATRYSLVVARGLGMKPLVILTTEDVQTKEEAGRVVDIYLERWGIEEANRFTKQGFDLEDVRALTWTGLKRMVQLTHLAYGFLALLVHGPRKQVERVASSFKAFGPVPEYMFYRLLEGIGELLRVTMDGGP
ncbi:transposase [Archangium violaceum]|uniref:transposase n=1 Tax=Archangium violaceum TaxID=83451 RepID=UPI0036DC5C9E